MKRASSRTIKHNRLIAEVADNVYMNEKRKIMQAALRKERDESIEYKIEFASKKCVQNIHPFEAELKKLNRAKLKDEEKIKETQKSILLAMDKAAADSVGRIIAEIKQPANQNEVLEVNVSTDEFYNDFENFCRKELKDYSVDSSTFNKIVEKFLRLNLNSLKVYGERYNYMKPAEQFEKNIKVIENIAVKEQELSI